MSLKYFGCLIFAIMDYWNKFKSQIVFSFEKGLPGYDAQKRMMGQFRPEAAKAPESAKQSGVLVLCYPYQEKVRTVLIERSADGGVHSGQIALPGGKMENTDTDIVATALREAKEEINLNATSVNVIGQLSSLYIPVSNFVVHPVLAISEEIPVLKASDYEVAAIWQPSLIDLFEAKSTVSVRPKGITIDMKVQAYLMEQERFVWGATAMILSELEAMLTF